MFDKRIISALVISLILTIGVSYFVIAGGFYSISADESTRSLMAYQWFKNGVIENTSWLPLHFILMGSGFYLIPDLILLPRIISILFGLLTIVIIGGITFKIFKNVHTTIIAVILTAFLPQRFILSLLPLPEIIYIFFIFTGGYFLFRYIQSGSLKSIIFTSLLWNIAALLRYESWIFLLVLSFVVLYDLINKKLMKKHFLILILLNSLVPVSWIVYNYINTGSWFYFLNEPAKIFLSLYNADYADLIAVNPFYQFLDQNLVSLNLIGVIGLYLLRNNRIVLKWLLIMFIPLMILSAVSLSGKTLPAHNFWRIPALWSILLVPLTAYTINSIKNYAVINKGIRIYIIILIMLVIQFSVNTFSMIELNSRRYTLNEKDMLTGKYLISYLNKGNENNSRVLIESVPSYQHFNITLASQEPFKFIYSERKRLEPVRKEKYKNVPINYFFVKSFSKIRSLTRDEAMKQVLKVNDWILFKKTL